MFNPNSVETPLLMNLRIGVMLGVYASGKYVYLQLVSVLNPTDRLQVRSA